MKTENRDIKYIIFDLGGVLLNIDYHATVAAFEELGLENPLAAFTKEQQALLFQDFEKGKIDADQFITQLQEVMPSASKGEIVTAWNAMLGEFPKARFDFLKKVSADYECFVLSNTNIIHQGEFEAIIDDSVGWLAFSNLFTKVYYSHELGMRKPDEEIFEEVLTRHSLRPENTCFIDDSPQHIATAKQMGIHAIHLIDGKEIWDVIE